jgi:hypothetical protein
MARSRDVASFVKDVDLRHIHWVDYDAPPRFDDSVTVTDDVLLTWTAHLTFNDSVVMSDSFNAALQTLTVSDAVAMSDAGVVGRYDYAGPDYFLTPADYVGETRVF